MNKAKRDRTNEYNAKDYKKVFEHERQEVKRKCCGVPMDQHGICYSCNVCDRIILKK